MSNEVSGETIEKNPGVPMLAARIRSICTMHGGMTETAKIMGLKPGRVIAWTAGKNEPPAVYLARLARLGNVSVDWLIADRRDGGQEMAWGEIRKGLDAMLRNLAVYQSAESKYHRNAP